MDSLLNSSRPLVFCPGCSHDRVVHSLDKTLKSMELSGENIAIVSDIGCSGLFDTFFNTHAFHGLHGRALTYATGIKMARPDLKVIVTMGDGGLGIGGAHLLSSCRRNIDLTLLVLNNFNYGMTGGQCSLTTPQDAQVGSGFLNRLERPMDICLVAGTAGAAFVKRASVYGKDLSEQIETAIRFKGFSLLDIWGACPGRYTKRNKLTPNMIQEMLKPLPPLSHFFDLNKREEYGKHYQQEAAKLKPLYSPPGFDAEFESLGKGLQEVVILGSAGQRIVTAGELLCLAGIKAGMNATQKNDYPVTVLRGHSVSEVILSEGQINYTGISDPSVVIALAPEGIARRKELLMQLSERTWLLSAKALDLPPSSAKKLALDFKAEKIKPQNWALTALAILAARNKALSLEMLRAAVKERFEGQVRDNVLKLIEHAAAISGRLKTA